MWQRLHRQRRGRIAAATAATASKHQSEPGCTLSFLKGLIVPAAEPVGLLSPPTAPIWVPQFTPPASPIPHHWRSALCHRATIRGGSHGQSGRIKKSSTAQNGQEKCVLKVDLLLWSPVLTSAGKRAGRAGSANDLKNHW